MEQKQSAMLDLSKMTNEIAEEQLEYTKKIKDETTKANTLAKLNAALNYGYGIILSTFNREIVSNGYITQKRLKTNLIRSKNKISSKNENTQSI